MSARVQYMVKGISVEHIRPVALLAGTMALALFVVGVLQAVAVEPAQPHGRGGRGGGQESQGGVIALTQRGVELVAEKKFEEALEVFDRAIEANEKYGMAHYQRGRALALMGRMEEAKETLLRSTLLQAGFAHGHQLASLAAQQLGDYEAAWDQAVRAILAGVEPSAFGSLQQASPPSPDIQERLAAWKVFVVGVDTRELMTREDGPFNDLTGNRRDRGDRDIRSTLAQVQPDLIEMQRRLSNALSDTPGFGLVPEPEMAQYLLVITPDSISADPRATMQGEFRLYEVEGNEVAFVRPVSFRNLSAESAVTTEIEQFIRLLENWKSERQRP